MKPLVLALALFAAYAVDAASHNVYVDVAMNILRHPNRGRIAGGESAQVNQFPHQVSLQWGASGQFSHICGGSIISEQVILTAAHCKANNYGNYQVKVGLLKQRAAPVTIPISNSNWRLHTGFPGGPVVSPYDIALIVLDSPLEINESVAKVALGNSKHTDINNFSKATVSGWGQTSAWGGVSNELKFVTVPRINNRQCFDDLKRILSGRNPPLDDTMLCVSNSANNYAGTCAGDSGGCLFVEDNGVRHQIGVVSWGISPCGTRGAPSVYTDVAQYLDWIEENSP